MKLLVLLGLASACASNATHTESPTMSNSNAKERLDSFINAVFNGNDASAADAYVDPAFVDHAPWPGQPGNLAGFKAGLAEFRTAFPDLKVDLERAVVEGDVVVGHITFSGTQLGPFMGAPATGKTFRVEAIDIIKLRDGKMVEHWGVMDVAGMAAQLGLAP